MHFPSSFPAFLTSMPRFSKVCLSAVAATTAVALAVAPLHAQSSPQNIALGKTVLPTGSFGVLGADAATIWGSECSTASLLPFSSITSGVFAAEGSLWCNNSVWWDAHVSPRSSNFLVVDLGSAFNIGNIVLQADNNDQYVVDMRLGSSGDWLNPLMFGASPIPGGGISTRSALDGGGFEASQLRIRATAGEGWYAISQISVNASTVVPEPGTVLLLGLGLSGVALLNRRRSQKNVTP